MGAEKNENKKKQKNTLSKKQKYLAWGIAALVAIAVGISVAVGITITNQPETVSYNEFCAMVEENEVETIKYSSGSAKFTFQKFDDPKTYETDNPKIDDFKEQMLLHDIQFEEVSTPIWLTILSYILPYLPFIILIILVLKMLPAGNRYSVDAASRPTTTFDDVAGLDEIKADMKTIAETLKNPELCQQLGARITKGVLLEGEPGNGKTLFARALAGETGVNFYSANASEFIEMYAGLGASRVRKLFKEAKEHAPSVVFIDELDAIGSKRDGSTDGAGREYTQCLNALLSAIDGFEATDGVLVIGATNRSEDLDPALIRPGRFDKQFVLTPPDCAAREQILRLHGKDKKFASDVDFAELAKDTVGFSGAGLETLLNEAALIALSEKTPEITKAQIEEASMQMALKGHIKKSIGNRNRAEHEIVSYHEAGHATATLALTKNQVRRITVLPTTSGAGGVTLSVPPADQQLPTVRDLENRVKVLYAGRAAEYLLAGKVEENVSMGAVQDIKEATKVIQNLVTSSQEQGLLDYADFGLAGQNKLMDLCSLASKRLWADTVALLEEHWESVTRIAKALIEQDSLSAQEVKTLYQLENALPEQKLFDK